MLNTTTTLTDETVNRLNDLIRSNIDSRKGFEEAAEEVNDPQLKTLFWEIAPRRQANAEELREIVRMNNRTPEDGGSVTGALHRWWLDVRAKLAGADDAYAVLAEAERGEDIIKHTYEDVLIETAGSPVNDVLTRQFAEVKRDHDRIRALRNAVKPN